jgi:hypothetical protein
MRKNTSVVIIKRDRGWNAKRRADCRAIMWWLLCCGLGLQTHGPLVFDLRSMVNQVHMKGYLVHLDKAYKLMDHWYLICGLW